MPIPPKGSIPGRKPKGLGDLLKGTGNILGGLSGEAGNLLSGILESLGKTLESIQNLNLEDLEKLTQGNEEAKEKINGLKKILGDKELDLGKLIELAAKHGGKGMIQSGLRGHILGIPLGGKDLPLERKRTQETFEVKGTRPQEAWKAPEKTKPRNKEEMRQPSLDVFDEKDSILIIGDMPGTTKEDIKYELKEKTLRIYTETGRKYEKEIKLPSPVTEKVNLNYRNGVLEVKLTKK